MLKILLRVILLVILGGLAYDVVQNGTFEKTSTFTFLKDSGVVDYGHIVMTEGKKAYGRTLLWAEKNIPVYYNETCTGVKPYIDLSYDLLLVLKSSLQAASQNTILYINKNYPGFHEKAAIMVSDTIAVAKQNFGIISHHVQNYTRLAVEYASNYMKS